MGYDGRMGGGKKPAARRREATGIDPRPVAAALFGLAFLLYVNTLGHGFVFDDGALILQNPSVTELRWSEMFGSGSYRPVRTLTYALNYALGKENPFGYHLFNVLLHSVNCLLLFRLLSLWSGAQGAAFAGALIFAAHPVQTAAVAYISGRKDLLATCFILAAMEVYTRYRRQGGRGRLAAVLLLALLAMLSKEVALVFPGLLLLVEVCVLHGGRDESLVTRLKLVIRRWAVPVAATLVLAVGGLLHAVYVSQATRMSGFWGGSVGANLGTSFKLFAHYLKLVFWPHPLIADYKGDVFAVSTGLTELATILSGALLIAFLLFAVQQFKARPLLELGMGWFLLTLLPVLQLIPFHEIAADHFLYLPLCGVSLAVTHLFLQWTPRQRRPAWAALATISVIFAALTIDRNRDWQDTQTLWEATYAAAPGSYRANTNLGQLYFRTTGRRREALEMTRRAVELDPNDPAAASNLGAMELFLAREAGDRGDLEKAWELGLSARENLKKALELRRSDGSILTNLGSAESLLGSLAQRTGRWTAAREHRSEAIRNFKRALHRDPRKEIKAAWFNLALVYLDLRRYAEAASSLEKYLEVNPDHAEANLRLGFCRIQTGDYLEAIDPLQVSLRSRPTPQAYDLLAASHQALGQTQQAVSVCREGLQRFPEVEFLQARLRSLTG